MIDYVELDNIPVTSNNLINILWDRNCEMTLAELTTATNSEFSTQWSKQEIKQFLGLLVQIEYVQTRRQGFKLYYSALGYGEEL